MEDFITLRGIVLKHAPVGDYDWSVTIFTSDKGKITAFARSARKPGNKLSGCVEPFCFGTFKLFVGRNSYTIIEADIENYFEGFRGDLEGACYGTFFLELADMITLFRVFVPFQPTQIFCKIDIIIQFWTFGNLCRWIKG